MSDHVIELKNVAKHFKKTQVLKSVTLTIEPGQTYALLGRNGAGKTTLIRMLLGMLKPDGGSMSVLGLDPQRDAMEIRRRVGYLAEDQAMYGWMTVEQIICFIAPFYPTWNHALANRYAQQFELPLKTKIKYLSKGQNVRLGLLLAMAHQPEVVILDDPVLGLDPIMRKDFNRDLITELQGQGKAVLYSSHLLYEVEPVADMVAILDGGVISRCGPTEELRDQIKSIVMPVCDYQKIDPPASILDLRIDDHEVVFTVDDAINVLSLLQAENLNHRVVDLNLDEIFEACVAGKVERVPPADSQLPITAN